MFLVRRFFVFSFFVFRLFIFGFVFVVLIQRSNRCPRREQFATRRCRTSTLCTSGWGASNIYVQQAHVLAEQRVQIAQQEAADARAELAALKKKNAREMKEARESAVGQLQKRKLKLVLKSGGLGGHIKHYEQFLRH